MAVAPAMFARVKANVELGYTEEDMQTGFALKGAVEALPEPGVLRDVEAAVAHAARWCLVVRSAWWVFAGVA